MKSALVTERFLSAFRAAGGRHVVERTRSNGVAFRPAIGGGVNWWRMAKFHSARGHYNISTFRHHHHHPFERVYLHQHGTERWWLVQLLVSAVRPMSAQNRNLAVELQYAHVVFTTGSVRRRRRPIASSPPLHVLLFAGRLRCHYTTTKHMDTVVIVVFNFIAFLPYYVSRGSGVYVSIFV